MNLLDNCGLFGRCPMPHNLFSLETSFHAIAEFQLQKKEGQKYLPYSNLPSDLKEKAEVLRPISSSSSTDNSSFISVTDLSKRQEDVIFFANNKRTRKMFNQNQIDILENVFEQTHYPDSSVRFNLSSRLNLSLARVQIWFQNRRAKYRKLDSIRNKKHKY